MKAMLNGSRFVSILVATILVSLNAVHVFAGGYPHFYQNDIECDSCHYVYGSEPRLLPPWTHHDPVDDDTQFNSLCWSFHNDLDVVKVIVYS